MPEPAFVSPPTPKLPIELANVTSLPPVSTVPPPNARFTVLADRSSVLPVAYFTPPPPRVTTPLLIAPAVNSTVPPATVVSPV